MRAREEGLCCLELHFDYSGKVAETCCPQCDCAALVWVWAFAMPSTDLV